MPRQAHCLARWEDHVQQGRGIAQVLRAKDAQGRVFHAPASVSRKRNLGHRCLVTTSCCNCCFLAARCHPGARPHGVDFCSIDKEKEAESEEEAHEPSTTCQGAPRGPCCEAYGTHERAGHWASYFAWSSRCGHSYEADKVKCVTGQALCTGSAGEADDATRCTGQVFLVIVWHSAPDLPLPNGPGMRIIIPPTIQCCVLFYFEYLPRGSTDVQLTSIKGLRYHLTAPEQSDLRDAM